MKPDGFCYKSSEAHIVAQGVLEHNGKQYAYASGVDASVWVDGKLVRIDPVDVIEREKDASPS